MSNTPPNRLLDLLGQDLAGYSLAHALAIGEGNGMPNRPVRMAATGQAIICLDGETDILDELENLVTPKAHGRGGLEAIVHVESGTAFWVNLEEPFAARAMHVLTREEFNRLKGDPSAFTWDEPAGP